MADISVAPTASATAPPARAAAPRAQRPAEDAAPDRTIQDVVTLSSGGEKVLNVGRGLELAKEFRQGGAGADQAKALRLAVDDVFRITGRFTQSVNAGFKAVFSFFRR
jgi:ribosomal protein L13E